MKKIPKPLTVFQRLAMARNALGIDDELWRGSILPRHGARADRFGRVSAKSLSKRAAATLLAELESRGADERLSALRREAAALAEHDGLLERESANV